MESLSLDVRSSVRSLLKRPAASLAVVAILASAIGAATVLGALFAAVVDDVPPVEAPADIGRVWFADETRPAGHRPASAADFVAWRVATRTLANLTALTSDRAILGRIDGVPVAALSVSSNYFALIGRRPRIGTPVDPESLADIRPVLISDRLWRERFNGDPHVIGQGLTLDAADSTIVGVMPPDVWFPSRGIDIWRPLEIDTAGEVDIVGRLQPGRSWSDVQAELNVLARSRTLARSLQQEARVKIGPGLQALVAPAMVILLIACLNVANLLVMRVLDRDREFAIRSALGATPLRLARLSVVDATILGAAAGGGGLLLATWGIAGLQLAGASALPALAGAVRPYLVAAIAAGAAAITILAVALLPAFRAARLDLRSSFASGLRQPVLRRFRYGVGDVVLVLQVALAVVLVVVAAFNLRLFDEVVRVSRSPGSDRVRVARVSAASDVADAARARLFGAIPDEIRASGGTEAVAMATSLPMRGQAPEVVTVSRPAGQDASCRVKVSYVTPEFFNMLGLTFRTGGPGAGVGSTGVVASESAAGRCFPDGIGGEAAVRVASAEGRWMPVTGVVGDPFTSKMPGTTEMASWLWVVGAREWPSNAFVLVRSAASHLSVRARDGVAVDAFTSYAERSGPSTAETGLIVGVLGGMSLLALLLAFTGVYAAMSQSCQSRIVELGIRLALGAPPARLVALAVARDVPLVAAGIVAGVVGTVWVTAIVWRDLLVFNALDLRVWVVVTTVLAGAALLASLGPALRALRVDPMTVLRAE